MTKQDRIAVCTEVLTILGMIGIRLDFPAAVHAIDIDREIIASCRRILDRMKP